MAASKSYIPLVEPATESDLKQIAHDLKLGIGDEQMKEYLEWVNNSLSSCDKLREIEEETIPVLYPRIPGVAPPRKDNSHNAWASKVTIKGDPTGLLAGKRIAIKDNIFIAGTPLQNGSKIWDGYTPEFDATVVTRILQAGGTIIGKSTCENQCYSGNSFTSASGAVLNPHDSSRSAGGSSSGSAVLVAQGEVEMALGGDQGGSVRLPACWSGCVGLKPTFGLVPVTGSIGMFPSMDHIGPMTANVTDAAILLEVIAGYDNGRDHRQRQDFVPPKYSQLLKGDLKNKKFAYVKEGFAHATNGVKLVIDDTVAKMRAAGAVVEEVSIPLQEKGGVLFKVLLGAFYDCMIRNCGQYPACNEFYQVSAAKHISHALETQAHDMQPTVKAVTMFGEYIRRKDGGQIVAKAMNMRPTLRQAYDKVLETYDALIMPTIPFVATKLPDKDLSIPGFVRQTLLNTGNTGMFNLSGHPSLTLNVAMVKPDDGDTALPVGLMVTGKHFEDDKVLDLAFGIEKLV